MNTIIEKVRAEVLRLIRKSPGPGSQYGFGMMSACNRILNFLDTIQEQPVCEGLEEEINRYLEPIHAADIQFEPFTQMTKCARHFAKWQKEQMMDEWLKDRDGCFWDGVEEGKKAMREKLMKEARPRFIHNVLSGNTMKKMVELYSEEIPKEKNVVKAIVIKED